MNDNQSSDFILDMISVDQVLQWLDELPLNKIAYIANPDSAHVDYYGEALRRFIAKGNDEVIKSIEYKIKSIQSLLQPERFVPCNHDCDWEPVSEEPNLKSNCSRCGCDIGYVPIWWQRHLEKIGETR